MSTRIEKLKRGGDELRYNHKEAFCLMWYQCKTCGGRVRIWNSRDGVTPFGVRCRAGGCASIDMLHADFRADLCVPDHVPEVGDLVFVDMTEARLAESIRERVENYWDHEQTPMSSMFTTKNVAVHELVRAEWREGMPRLMRVIPGGEHG